MTPEATGRAVDRVEGWARELTAAEVVELFCAEAPTPPVPAPHRLVRWPGCLGRLRPADLARVVAAAPGVVVHVHACRDPGLAATVAGLRAVLEDLGAGGRLQVAEVAPGDPSVGPVSGPGSGRAADPDRLPLSRRQLLGWVRRPREEPRGEGRSPVEAPPAQAERVTGAGRPAPSSPADGADHGEAADQVALVAALRAIDRQSAGDRHGRGDRDTAGDQRGRGHGPATGSSPEPPGGRRVAGPGLPPPRALRLSVEGCTACSTCVRACPTGALVLTPLGTADQHGGAGPAPAEDAVLAVVPAACVGCRQCVALCPVQAVTSGEELSWTDLARLPAVQELETVRTRPCARCRTPFSGDGDLCQVCRMRAQNPFGSWLPPGYVAPRVYAPPEDERP